MAINDYHFVHAVSKAEDVIAGFARRSGHHAPRRTAHNIARKLAVGSMLGEAEAHLALEALEGRDGELGRLRDGVERQWLGMDVEALDQDIDEDD
jgi:hypothetical protein